MTAPVFVVTPAVLAAAAPGSVVRLDGAEGRHASTVRRLAPGEAICLVDGDGHRAHGRVVEARRDELDVRVERLDTEPAPEPRICVVQALPKGERGELAVELLTEVGVDVVVPWSAAACVAVWKGDRAVRGQRKWLDAAVAAAKQARRARFPVVEPLAGTGDVVDRVRSAALAVVLHEQAAEPIAGVELPASGDVVIVVGPEGGITPAELEALTQAGARSVRLGPSVLRTSSAGMAAVAALLAPSQRWAIRPATEVGG